MNLARALLLLGALLPQSAWGQVAGARGLPAVGAPTADPETLVRALSPDTVLAPAGGPRIALLPSPGVGVAALRLAVPVAEGPAEAGAGRLLADLGLERLRALARPVGAQVSTARTPWGVAYSVVGAAADFEYLAYLLREAVATPDVTGPGFAEAKLRLQAEAARAVETPAGRIAAELRAQLAPGAPPLEGTPASVRGLDPATVRQVWLRTHRPSAMTLVVSAPVVPEVVLAATRGMGAPEEPAAPLPDAPAPVGPRVAAPPPLRSWYGEAWSVGAPGDLRGAVLASLVAEGLRAGSPPFEVSVELWDLPGGSALSVVGTARSRDVQAMRRAVSGALSRTRSALAGPQVADAAARVRRDVMLAARTPAGLVAVVGRAAEAEGDPLAAARGLETLDAMDAEALAQLLDRMLRSGPRSAQVRP